MTEQLTSNFKTGFSSTVYWLFLIGSQCLLVLCWLSCLDPHSYTTYQYNTDYLYLPSLYTDLFEDGGKLGSWHLAPSPYFFPDMLIYFPIRFFIGNIGTSSIVFACIQLMLIGYFFFKLLVELTDLSTALRLNVYCFLLLNGVLLIGIFFNENFLAHLLVSKSAHMGAVLASIIGYWMFAKYYHTNQFRWLIGLFLVMVLTIISDRIFIVQTCLPMFIISTYLLIRKRNWKLFAVIVCGGMVGWVAFRLIAQFLTFIPSLHSGITVSQSIHNFEKGLKFFLKNDPFTGWLICCQLVMLILLPLIGITRIKTKTPVFFLVISGMILSFVFPVLYAFIQDVDTFRYLMHSFVVASLIIPVAVFSFRRSKKMWASPLMLSSVAVFFILVVVLLKFDTNKITGFIHYKRPYVELIENNRIDLKNGISDHWHTKEVYLMGGKTTRVLPVDEHLIPHVWQVNHLWYTGMNETDRPVFNFTINIRADQWLGPPVDVIGESGDTLFIYDDFVFRKQDRNIRIFPLKSSQQ